MSPIKKNVSLSHKKFAISNYKYIFFEQVEHRYGNVFCFSELVYDNLYFKMKLDGR